MKKWKQFLLSAAAACALLGVTAGAADFDNTADTLKNMGLFAGTNTGYELERAPTRAEAATMLVRLLGKAAEAETEWAASSDGFAFRDMGDYDWAKPYVHWLAGRNLAAGTSADRFTPGAPCTAQMYAAFLLRSLGYYEINGDFAFDDALDFARAHSIINDANCDPARFLRGHVVAASYTALSCQPRSGEADLLTRLVEEGAVPAEAAAAEQRKFSAYRSYQRVMAGAAGGAALENVASLSVTGGVSLELAAVSQLRLNGARLSSAGSLTITVPGRDPFVTEHSGYYADGRWYTAENGTKTWQKASLDTVLQGYTSQTAAVPLCLLDGLETTGNSYTLTYSETGKAWYAARLKQLESALGSTLGLDALHIDSLSTEVKTANGQLVSVSSGAILTGKLTNRTTGTKTDIALRAQQNSSVTGSGPSVEVTAPAGLSSYTEAP